MKRSTFLRAALVLLATFLLPSASLRAEGASPLTVVVMDPLAAPLSCPCVQGYAQRNYDRLGEFLENELGRSVKVVYNESLTEALDDEDTGGEAHIVIGKRSVVAAQAKERSLGLQPVLSLSGKDGQTTQTGLIVVPAADPAKTTADLKDYRIIFGPANCDEKHAAALTLLKQNGIKAPATLETCSACSDGATTILELGPDVRAATVISSYAAPLLEGCGTIKKGDLRVIGKTAPVPFVTAFVSELLPEGDRSAIVEALRQVADEPILLIAIESKSGFVPEKAPEPAKTAAEPAKKKN